MGGLSRTFKAEGLSQKEYDIVEDARRAAEKGSGQSLTNRELLLLLANDPEAKWRKA